MKKTGLLFIAFLMTHCVVNNPEQAAAEAPEVYSLLGLEYYAPADHNPKLDSNLAVAKKTLKLILLKKITSGWDAELHT